MVITRIRRIGGRTVPRRGQTCSGCTHHRRVTPVAMIVRRWRDHLISVRCETCDGYGLVPPQGEYEDWEPCEDCEGHGDHWYVEPLADGWMKLPVRIVTRNRRASPG